LAFVGVNYLTYSSWAEGIGELGEIAIAAAQARDSKSAPACPGGVTSLQALVP
jgi:hypothetical protein